MSTRRTGSGLGLILLLLAMAGLAGCATRPAKQSGQKDAEYVPYADRPLSGRDYWAKRDLEDRIEREHERRNSGR